MPAAEAARAPLPNSPSARSKTARNFSAGSFCTSASAVARSRCRYGGAVVARKTGIVTLEDIELTSVLYRPAFRPEPGPQSAWSASAQCAPAGTADRVARSEGPLRTRGRQYPPANTKAPRAPLHKTARPRGSLNATRRAHPRHEHAAALRSQASPSRACRASTSASSRARSPTMRSIASAICACRERRRGRISPRYATSCSNECRHAMRAESPTPSIRSSPARSSSAVTTPVPPPSISARRNQLRRRRFAHRRQNLDELLLGRFQRVKSCAKYRAYRRWHHRRVGHRPPPLR